jgi:hypothetical protein
MHSRYKYLFILLLFSSLLTAQQPVNAGFEDWKYEPGPPPLPIGPDGWQSNNLDLPRTAKERPVNTFIAGHTGNYGALLFSVADSVGNPVIAKLWQHIALKGNRPDYISLFTYNVYGGTDPPKIEVVITSGARIIGSAVYYFSDNSENEYTEVKVPVTYFYEGLCDSMLINIQSSTGTGNGVFGNIMSIDDISIHYSESRFEVGELYPNPANQGQTLTIFNPMKAAVFIDLFDGQGKLVRHNEFHSQEAYQAFRLDCSELDEGLYFYSISSGNNTVSKKITIAHEY